jgi:secondary thiamine-phosphate synthase enzyme
MTRTRRSAAFRQDITLQAQSLLEVETDGQGFFDITREARAFLKEAGAGAGLLTLFCRHTSASLAIQENADPDVQRDLLTALDLLAPRDFAWSHHLEGPDDMPAHVRALLTGASLSIPVLDGQLRLGTWQGVYVVEHRDRAQRREIVLLFTGKGVDSR